ncbi:MAG: hypothetical protein LBU16_01575 [Treponema sp.]|nr:hypothetical protein [Treponema sp.]
MRKNFGMLWAFVTGVFVLITALFYAGCAGSMPAEGEFENQTSNAITVTIVGSKFSVWSENAQEFTPSTNTCFSVYSNENVKIRSAMPKRLV